MATSLWDIQVIETEDSKHYFPDVDQGHLYLATALAGEVGEFCNDVKKWARGSITEEDLRIRSKGELADILIYLVMAAEYLGIDLEKAWKEKKEYNDGRYKGTVTRTE